MYIYLEDLSKRFQDSLAVDRINLKIKEGEIISLLGPSGCGKTTTLKMIGGFIKPTTGQIYIDNINITNMMPENRPVSTVFQDYALFPHMTAIENVIYGLKYRKDYNKKAAIEERIKILKAMGLEDHHNTRVPNLSGGQQQRVALARALIVSPKVLLLDEPLSNLDAKLRVRMRKEIKEIQKKFNITMIFATHDQEEAMSISDRIVVMNRGRIEQIGPPEVIYSSPNNEFIENFIGRMNIIKINDKLKRVRPEEIKLSKNNGDLIGAIIDRHFLGSKTTYFLKIDEQILEVDVVNSHEEKFDVGENVYIELINRRLS